MINQNNKLIKQVVPTSSSNKGHDPVAFKYSRLALSLSVCLMTSVCAHQNAYAETIGNNNDDLVTDTQITQKDEVEAALIALKLKQAVERGLIDQSVLEDYKRETLNANINTSKNISTTKLPDSIQNSQKKNLATKKNNPKTANRTDKKNGLHTVTNNGLSGSNETKAISYKSLDEKFEATFTQAKGQNKLLEGDSLKDDVKVALDFEEQSISTPQELENILSQIETPEVVDESLPVAILDSKKPPIGLNQETDDIGFVEPDSRETLGLTNHEQPNSENTPLSEQASFAAANKSETADQQSTTGINPEQYLPKYNENDSEIDVSTKVASENTDDSDAEIGFFKSLYNRVFNGGYTALPKIKADVYLANETKLNASGKPVLAEADKNDQPFRNIEAALEHITVESIRDFTAVVPKLREVATGAAEAVGYYNTKMTFEKESKNRVNVIIQELGEPVKVSSHIIDIRGKGSDLKEFEAIKEEAQPMEDSTFNHGEYKNTKSKIESVSENFGFFDSQWLNKSVDIILPDNTADVDLIYETGERYRFDDVVFYTIDREQGRLTVDPDKLPVKPEILHQLYDFEKGDKYYRPLVTDFTNNLSETRYFNAVNVDTIRPEKFDEKRSTLDFEDQDNIADSNEESDIIDELLSGSNDTAINNKQVRSDQKLDLEYEAKDENLEEDSEFEPIEYSVDDETNQRLKEIKAKAERLSNLPDDRVLDAEKAEAKSLLGKVSNAISNAVEKIFPENEQDIRDADILAKAANSKLDSRKTPEDVAKDKVIPIYVFIDADKPKDVDLGIGYGTDTGVRAVARLDHNLINRDGYQAGVEVATSEINRSVNLYAKRPWKHPLNDTLNAKLSYVQEEINQGEGNLDLLTNTIKAGLARQIRSDSGWNRTYSLNYRLDKLESGIEGPKRSDLPVPFNREDSKFEQQALLLGYVMDKTSADSVSNPTKGWHQFYSIEAGSEGTLTDTNMAIARGGVNGVYSFGEDKKHQLLGSIEGGYIWADNFEDVPYKLRFFAGGDRSIRGYDYDSLSPREKGYLTGGQVLALGSTEYNYEFKPGLRGAVFADVGNAYDTDFSNDTKLGVGFGVRWASPVGMVRLDLAAGILEDSIPVRLHFFIGSPLQ